MKAELKGTNSYAIQYLYRTLFDSLFSDGNYDAGHPLASVLKYPNEPMYSTTPLMMRWEEWASYGIKDTFGGSFLDFISCPAYLVHQIVTVSEKAYLKAQKEKEEEERRT